MTIVDCVQGSPEWWGARMGRPTGSNFGRIVKPEPSTIQIPVEQVEDVLAGYVWEGLRLTEKQLEALQDDYLKCGTRRKLARVRGLVACSQADAYLALLVEQRLGVHRDEFAGSPDIERGHRVEAEARNWLAMEFGEDVAEVGLIEEPGGRYSSSPDGLIWRGDRAEPVELKVPRVATLVDYHLTLAGGIPAKYAPQCHAHLLVTGADVCHFLAYPDLQEDVVPQFVEALKASGRYLDDPPPPYYVRVERNDYTACLAAHLDRFCDRLDLALSKFAKT